MNLFLRKLRLAALIGLSVASLNLGYSDLSKGELDKIIATMQSDDYDARYEARMDLQDHVSRASLPGNEIIRASLERDLLALLNKDLPATNHLWILRQLQTIGSEASVEILAKLLQSENLHIVDGARMTLIPNRSPKALDALVEGLKAAEDAPQTIAYIAALQQRGDSEAATVVADHVSSDDSDIASAAIMASAKLSNTQSNQMLAFLESADQNAAELAQIELTIDALHCQQLLFNGSNSSVRTAALQRYLELDPINAAKDFTQALETENFIGKNELIRVALLSGNDAMKRFVLQSIGSLDTEQQAVVAGTLAAARKSRKNEMIILSLLETDSEPLKVQAIEALGKIGSVASLPILLDALESDSRELTETASHAIASLKDRRVDSKLKSAAKKGEEEARVNAIMALGFRNSPGSSDLLSAIAAGDESKAIRKEALTALERVGDQDSLSIMVDLIIDEPSKGGLRRDAQRALKRTSLRIGDGPTAWRALNAGLERSTDDPEAQDALLAVIDSAPAKGTIEYIRNVWNEGDPDDRKTILRVLSLWRDWDGGYLLLDLADQDNVPDEIKDKCYKSANRLISGGGTKSIEARYDFANAAIARAQTPERRQAILDSFRNVKWQDRNYVNENKVDPAIKEAVLRTAE